MASGDSAPSAAATATATPTSTPSSTTRAHAYANAPALAKAVAKIPPGLVNPLCGSLAGLASGIVTCPLDVIKTKLQAQGSFRQQQSVNVQPSSSAIYRGLLGTARTIIQQDGIKGMYRGLGPMMIGYIPTWAVYMGVYDRAKRFFANRFSKSDSSLLPLLVLPISLFTPYLDHPQPAISPSFFCLFLLPMPLPLPLPCPSSTLPLLCTPYDNQANMFKTRNGRATCSLRS